MKKHLRFHLAQIDTDLIRSARELIDGANVHKVKTLICVYENSVHLHNEGPGEYFNSYIVYERQLREFVVNAKRIRDEAQGNATENWREN